MSVDLTLQAALTAEGLGRRVARCPEEKGVFGDTAGRPCGALVLPVKQCILKNVFTQHQLIYRNTPVMC